MWGGLGGWGGPPFMHTLPLARGRSSGSSGTMSLAAAVPSIAAFALRCLLTVTRERAMFHCQFDLFTWLLFLHWMSLKPAC